MSYPALPSAKEVVILELLSDAKEHYGLEILAGSAGRLTKGGLYVILSRMEEKGYIRGRKEDLFGIVPRAPRRLYQITGEGERALRAVSLLRAFATGAVTV